MKYNEYQQESQRTFKYTNSNELNNQFLDELHCVIGVSTESGELLDAYKKAMLGKPIDKINIKEEIADIMWYISNLCRLTGIDFEEALEINLNKLRKRFPEKFDINLSNNRNIKEERKILES